MWQLPTMWSSPALPLKSTGKPSLLATDFSHFSHWLLRSLVLPLDPLSGFQPLSLHANLEFPPSLQRRWRLSFTLSSTGHSPVEYTEAKTEAKTVLLRTPSHLLRTFVGQWWWPHYRVERFLLPGDVTDSQHNTFLMVMLVWINLLLYKDFSSLIDLYCPSMCSICNYAQ